MSKAVKMGVLCGENLSARRISAPDVLSGAQLHVWGAQICAIAIESSVCPWISAMSGE